MRWSDSLVKSHMFVGVMSAFDRRVPCVTAAVCVCRCATRDETERAVVMVMRWLWF